MPKRVGKSVSQNIRLGVLLIFFFTGTCGLPRLPHVRCLCAVL